MNKVFLFILVCFRPIAIFKMLCYHICVLGFLKLLSLRLFIIFGITASHLRTHEPFTLRSLTVDITKQACKLLKCDPL